MTNGAGVSLVGVAALPPVRRVRAERARGIAAGFALAFLAACSSVAPPPPAAAPPAASGNLLLEGLPAGKVSFAVRRGAPGGFDGPDVPGEGSPGTATAEIRPGEAAEVTLDLVRRALVAEVPPAEGILRVVDDETGAPIPGATVNGLVELRGGREWSLEPVPGSGKAGEFRFRGPPGIVWIGVEAPGHVTMDDFHGLSLELRPGVVTEQVVRLPRAGEVQVEFRGGGPSVTVEEVSIRRKLEPGTLGWVARGFPVKANRAGQDGLPPGPYTLEVKPGRGFERVPDLEVEILAGKVTEVVVDLVPRSPEADAAEGVRGTVTFHPGWGERESTVRFRGLRGRNRQVDESAALAKAAPGRPSSFALGRLPPGRYRVEVAPQWTTEVEVPEGGGEFHFSIPEPAEVLVRVVAAETGEPLPGTGLYWTIDTDDGAELGVPVVSVAEGPGTGGYRLLVPPGVFGCRAHAPGRVAVSLERMGPSGSPGNPELRSGERIEGTIRLARAGTVRLLLRCEGRLLARREVEAWILSGPGAVGREGVASWRMNGSGGARTQDGLPPGMLTLEIRDPEGRFEPVPDREIQVRAGETTEVSLELVRGK
jgi:hypothetical protein